MTNTTDTVLPPTTRAHRPPTGHRPVLRFALHYLEMLVAMLVGMVALAPAWNAVWPGHADRPDLHAVIMATNMAIGMALWMRVRRHGWSHTAAMSAAMYVAFLLVLPPYWAGLISGDTMFTAGHLLMLPLMLAVMLRHARQH